MYPHGLRQSISPMAPPKGGEGLEREYGRVNVAAVGCDYGHLAESRRARIHLEQRTKKDEGRVKGGRHAPRETEASPSPTMLYEGEYGRCR